jgi:hypothetical protein
MRRVVKDSLMTIERTLIFPHPSPIIGPLFHSNIREQVFGAWPTFTVAQDTDPQGAGLIGKPWSWFS